MKDRHDQITKQVASLLKKKGLSFTEICRYYLSCNDHQKPEDEILQMLFDTEVMNGISWRESDHKLPPIGVHHCLGISFKIWLSGYFQLIPKIVSYRGKAQRGIRFFGLRNFGRCVFHWLMFSLVFYYPLLRWEHDPQKRRTKAELAHQASLLQDQITKLDRKLKNAENKLRDIEKYAILGQTNRILRIFSVK